MRPIAARASGLAAVAAAVASLSGCTLADRSRSATATATVAVTPTADPAAEAALQDAAAGQLAAALAGDAVRLAGYPSPRCTEEERGRIVAASALPAELAGGAAPRVARVIADGAFGSVAYALDGVTTEFQAAFDAVDSRVDFWELIGDSWYTVDLEACAGDRRAGRDEPAPGATSAAPQATPDETTQAFAALWELASLEVHPSPTGHFAGAAQIVQTDPDVGDADFTVSLFQGEDAVAVLSGSVRRAGGGTLTVALVSDDPFVGGGFGYDFRARPITE